MATRRLEMNSFVSWAFSSFTMTYEIFVSIHHRCRAAAYQVHRFRNQATRQADIDSRFLTITGQDPDLDVGLLQGVNRLRHAVLKAIFDSGSSEEVKVVFNEFRGLVQLFLQ